MIKNKWRSDNTRRGRVVFFALFCYRRNHMAMSRNVVKIAKIAEWVGVGIILFGVALFSVIYVRKIRVSVAHYSALLWILGFGLLCYVPQGFVRFFQKRSEAEELSASSPAESELASKAAVTLKRTLALKIIVAAVLIIYGALKFLGLR